MWTARSGAGSSVLGGSASSVGSGGETAVVMIVHYLRQEVRLEIHESRKNDVRPVRNPAIETARDGTGLCLPA